MNWTEQKPPNGEDRWYDHVECETPLGNILIEWKSWKINPDYGVIIEDSHWISTEYSLEDAKESARKYLEKKSEELKLYLQRSI